MVEVTNALEGNSADKANISTLAAISQQYVLDRLELPTSDTPVLRLATPRTPAGSLYSGWHLSTLAGTPALRLENTPALRLENTPALWLVIPKHFGWQYSSTLACNTPALHLVIPQHSTW